MTAYERVFITGGASGLGAAFARHLSASGARVCLGDVDDDAGAALARELGAKAHFLHCDVTNESDLEAAAQWMKTTWGGVDLLVNNAGVAQMGSITETSAEDWRWAVEINLLGVARGCRTFVPMMKAQRSGTILNIASMAGLVHLPDAGAYNATKAAVVALTETLELELAGDGIRAAVACPSFFRSDLAKNMRAADKRSEAMARRMVERARMSADDIARLIVEGLEDGQTFILPHRQSHSAWRMKRLLPHPLWLRVIRRELRKLRARVKRAEAPR